MQIFKQIHLKGESNGGLADSGFVGARTSEDTNKENQADEFIGSKYLKTHTMLMFNSDRTWSSMKYKLVWLVMKNITISWNCVFKKDVWKLLNYG